MRPLWTSLPLLLASLLHAEGYTCPSGKSKETITLAVGESVDFSTQETDTYGKNVRCQVKFKRGKQSKCKLNFSCSAFTLTAKNSNCNKGSDFMKIGKEKFCEDNTPDVTINGRTLNVLFRSNKKSKGGAGAECTATCIDPQAATTTSAPPTAPPTTTSPPATTAAPTTGPMENQTISWFFGMNPAELCATPGTNVTFNWTSGHTLQKVEADSFDTVCNNVVNTPPEDGPKTWTAPSVLGFNYFACGVPGHCSSGMKALIEVKAVCPA